MHLTGVPEWVDAKIVRDYTAKARAKAESSPTAMAVAFHKAKPA